MPPKGKPPTRRLSTPKSVDEEETTIQKGEKQRAQIHKRPVPPVSSTNESKYNPSGTGGSTVVSSSIFKLTEPPPPSKTRATRDLDEKWSDMFGTNKQEDSAKEDLLAKLVADEQQERRLAANAAAQATPGQRSNMNMFESSTRSTTATSKFYFIIKLFFIYVNLNIL